MGLGFGVRVTPEGFQWYTQDYDCTSSEPRAIYANFVDYMKNTLEKEKNPTKLWGFQAHWQLEELLDSPLYFEIKRAEAIFRGIFNKIIERLGNIESLVTFELLLGPIKYMIDVVIAFVEDPSNKQQKNPDTALGHLAKMLGSPELSDVGTMFMERESKMNERLLDQVKTGVLKGKKLNIVQVDDVCHWGLQLQTALGKNALLAET